MLLDKRLRELGGWLFRFRSWWFVALVPMLAGVLYLERDELAATGTPAWMEQAYELACFGLAMGGELIRMLTVGFIPTGTSGRNTQSQKASALNATGAYSVLRNPLYLGNFLILIGIVMLLRSWEVTVLTAVFFTAIYIPIILVEERFLLEKFAAAYEAYTSRVPCVLPKLRLWNTPNLKWNLRMVIRREHDTIFSIVLSFVLIAHFRAFLATGTLRASALWLSVGAVGLVLWLTAEVLKKFTGVLKSRDDTPPSTTGQAC